MNARAYLTLASRLLIVVSAFALSACGGQVELYAGLSDGEANQVVAALRDDGLPAERLAAKGGVTVTVRESDLARANAVLTARGLPHRQASRIGDVFKKEGLISSPLEERARYVSALAQELESTLSQIDGVVVARVHVVLPEKPGPGEPLQPPSAAIFIKHLPALEPDAVGYRVRQLVARSIPGMGESALDRVSVVFIKADALPKRPLELPDHTALWLTIVLSLAGAAAVAAWRLGRRGWRGWRAWRPWSRKGTVDASAPASAPSTTSPTTPSVSS